MFRIFIAAMAMVLTTPCLATPGTDQDKSISDLAGIQEFVGKLAVQPVEFSYSMVYTENETVASGNGNVVLYGRSFRMNGNGLESVCDGKSVWVIDDNAKEVAIESAETETANPALLLSTIGENFKIESVSQGDYKGTGVTKAVFNGIDDEYFSSVTVYLTDVIVGAEIDTKDGISLSFDIPSFRFLAEEEVPSLIFSLSEDRFDSSWIVTDLR